MKKFLAFLGILILVVIIVGIVLGIIEPKDVTIKRNTTIKADKGYVFDQVSKFKNWPHWSPWILADSTIKITYQGEDGQPGSSYHWVGDEKKSGEGDMHNTGIKDGEIDYLLSFTKPFKKEATGSLQLSNDDNNETKVTWTIHFHTDFPWNAINAFINMDKMVGKDFEHGLANLKAYSEANSGGYVAIKDAQFPGHTYAGVRKTMAMNDMMKFFANTYGMLGKALNSQIAGPAAGLFYKWDTVAHQADIAAVFPVMDTTKPVKGVSFITVPSSKAYMVEVTGPYSSSGKAHNALMKHVGETKANLSLVIEEYKVGPYQTPDSNKYVTDIYYLYQ